MAAGVKSPNGRMLRAERLLGSAELFGSTGGCTVMDWSVSRVLACAVGAGSAGAGLFQYSLPVAAASRWGIDPGTDPTSAIMMRGAGARDCFTGSALLYSAVRGGDYRPWLATRAAADAADGVAGGLSLRAGTRSRGRPRRRAQRSYWPAPNCSSGSCQAVIGHLARG